MNRPDPRDPATVSATPGHAPPDETTGPARPTDPDSAPPDPQTQEPPTATFPPVAGTPTHVGRYTIRRLLGRGGMGAVYLAYDPELDRPVALKVPRLSGPDAEERFLREARAAAAVTHPNLCPVYDAGRADGVLYLAMAYIPGPTLTQVIRRDAPLAPERAVAIATAVARGMGEAHRHGIVHRDLKPGNVILDKKGEPVVTDFGLALRGGDVPVDPERTTARPRDPRLTAAGAILGTPAYMPPEQAGGRTDRVGPTSDVYSLGAILYELLTDRPPFRAETIPELLRLIETEPAPAPSAARPGIPAGLDAVCRKAMAKDPAERFASMEEFAAALAPFAVPPRRRWRKIAVAAALAAVLLAVAAVVIYVRTNKGTVEVRLSDPAAQVEVTIDGVAVAAGENGRVREVRVGPHTLEVRGAGFEPETQTFDLKRGEKLVLAVDLRALPPAAPPPAPAGAWNEELKRTLEELFPAGVGKGIGRHLYGELDTAIETHKDGEWRVGPGMTRDGRAVVLKVANDKLFVAFPTAEQVTAWGLRPSSVERIVDAGFRPRHLDLMRLTPDGPVTFAPQSDGKLAVTVRFKSEVVSDRPIESVNLIVQAVIRADDKKEGTTEVYHQPGWTRPPSGPQEITFTSRRTTEGLQPGFTVRVSVEAFVVEPRAGRYRISNELIVPLTIEK